MLMLDNKVAIITGSTSGIGKAAAELFASEGCKVAIVGRDKARGEQTVKAIIEKGGAALFIPADLLHKSAPGMIIDRVIEEWGSIDIIVNNAALVCSKPIERITHQDWDDLLAVNLKAAFFMTQAALPWLKENKGCVINISSSNAIRNEHKNMVYDTAKAALNHMTSGMALELRKVGVRCNVIMPGGTLTPLLDIWLDQNEDYDKAEELEKLPSDPSIATSEQVAQIILMVAGDQSAWLNGAQILADGGYSLG